MSSSLSDGCLRFRKFGKRNGHQIGCSNKMTCEKSPNLHGHSLRQMVWRKRDLVCTELQFEIEMLRNGCLDVDNFLFRFYEIQNQNAAPIQNRWLQTREHNYETIELATEQTGEIYFEQKIKIAFTNRRFFMLDSTN